MFLPAFLYTLVFLIEMLMVFFRNVIMGWGVGRGSHVGTALFSSRWMARWEGSSSSRYIPCFEADGHQPLCIQLNMDQEKELFLSFQKIGSLPGKVNFLLPETKGLFVCLVFLPRCPSPQLNFFPILFLLYVFWISWFPCTKRRGLVLPSSISGSVLHSWLSWALFSACHLLHVCWFYSSVSI